MSSQGNEAIPVVHAPDGVGYKLIELPAELLALLESDNPPVLTLESSDTSAVLKSGDKSWGLRQNNTSNALMLLQSAPGTAPTADPGAEMPRAKLNAIATVHDTVELAATDPASLAPASRGKWHEKFARGR